MSVFPCVHCAMQMQNHSNDFRKDLYSGETLRHVHCVNIIHTAFMQKDLNKACCNKFENMVYF